VKREALFWAKLVEKTLAGPGETYIQQAKKLNPKQFAWKEELMELRKKLGERLKIRGHVIISNDQIIEVVVNQSLECLRPWQKQLVQEQKVIKEILSN
jgi:hypothetical protein